MLLVSLPPSPKQDYKRQKEGGISMKKYMLTAIINGKVKIYNQAFSSRSEAIDYIFSYYQKHNDNLRVEEEYYVNNDIHNIEYVSDYDNRFRIQRIAM